MYDRIVWVFLFCVAFLLLALVIAVWVSGAAPA